MKKPSYVLILTLVVVSGVVFANREIKNETQPSVKALSIADGKARQVNERKKWEATPDGIKYKEWEASPEGKKVSASHDKIRQYIQDFSNMEAVVTSVTFRRSGKSAGIKWLIVSMNGEKYMMQFNPKDFEQLKSLRVNDKIIIRSRSAGYSHNHPYLILSGDYIEQNKKYFLNVTLAKIRAADVSPALCGIRSENSTENNLFNAF